MKGIRTIALRLTGTKEAAEELEEMGEDTSDMIMSQSKMRDLIMNATRVASNNYQGFDIQDELGRYKSTYEIMLGLAQIWDEIQQADFKTGDNRQNLLLESIAGKNRASIAASILQNPKTLQSVYEDSSTKAAGSAMEENQKYLDSISGHLAKLQNAWQELWANAANRDIINMFIDLGTTILNVINEVGGLQSAFTLLYGGTILKGLMTADSWLVKFVQGLDNAKVSSQGLGDSLNNVFTNLTGGGDPNKETRWKGLVQIQKNRENAKTGKTKNSIADETKEVIEANKELAESEELVQAATEGSTIAKEADMATEGAQTGAKMAGAMAEEADAASTANNTDQTNKNTIATEANTAAEGAQSVAKGAGGVAEGINSAGGIGGMIAGAVANPMTWLMAIPAILALISTIVGSIKKQQQELIDSEKEAASTWQEAKTGIDEYAQKYQELHAQLQNTNLSEEEQADIKKQIYELQKQITEEYGNAADGVNLINGNLDEQLEKLRQIKAEEAKKNLLDNEKEYENARKAMEQERSYDMVVARNAPVTQDAQDILKKYGYELKQRSAGMGTVEQYIEFKGDASDAEQALKDLYNEVGEFSEDERVSKGLNTFFDSISAATEQNNQVLRDHQEAYNAFLEAKIFDNDNLYGDAQKTAGEVLIQLEDAVNDYNIALQSGDTSQIEKAQKTFESLKDTVQDITKDMGEVYSRPFDDIIDNVNQTAETAYNFQKKMDDPKVHSMAESVFGKLADNKKVSKQVQDEVLDAAGEILSMQRELAKNGLTDILSPLYEDIDTKHTSRFGNVDLANRPVLKWNNATRQRYSQAWASWNTDRQGNVEPMYDDGTISTVLGTWDDKFGANKNISIAFTPLLNTGSELELLDADTVYNYINDLIEQATDESGKLDTNKLFTLDADPNSGKNLIAAVGKTSEKVASVMHYLGKDGAYTMAMARLKKLAEQTNIPIEKMLASMRNLDNTSGIKQMFADALPSVEDVKMALADTTGQFQDLQDFAQQNFNITAETPDAEIQGFIEAMQAAELVAVASTENSQKSLDDFYVDVSNKINTINELTSIASKGLGQGGLSFTKLLDENKKLVESDVSKIVDSFQHIYDLDVGSLFEETATGIKLNMDAYRQLIQEEESATKLQFASQRKKLESELKIAEAQGASKTEINKIKEQITDLDMLAAAYDGATSATAKYLAQQNAADYGDSYEMFRDTTVKRADELMGKGMIGTEEFRTIAQLFSYDSLATASADKVLEAYQTGYNNVKKYLTEDATIGMQTFLDDLVALPEEYGKFIKDADGNYMLEFTDAQEDKLAEHLNVSKDMLESFYDMLNALGFNVHFFRDGTLDEFDKLNENIHNSQDRLKELKETANDKDLIPDDLFEVNADELNTVEELQNYLTELSQLEIDPEVNPEEYEAWQTLLDQIKQKIDVLNSTGQNEDGSVSLGDFKQADEKVKYFKENFEDTIATLKEKSEDPVVIKAAIENDQEIKDFGTMLAQMPPEIQTYIAANLGINGFEPTNDPEQITQQLFGHLEQGIEIPAEVKVQDYYGEGHAPIGIDNIEAGVTVDPASEEAAKQEVADTIGSAEPDVGVRTHLASSAEELEPLAQFTSNGEIHLNLNADASQANEVIEETKEEATKETEMPLVLKAENTAQEAADQAGVQQGVQTTKHETTIKDEQVNTTVTSDTSQIDAAKQTVTGLQALSGSTISVNLAVSGFENIETAKTNIDELIAKDKSKVTVSVNGNATMFNKTYTQTNLALNTLAQKKTEPKITANNSNLKDKVSEAKNKLNSIDDKKVHITASNSGFGEITTWKRNTYDNLHDKDIKVTTHYSYTGDPKMGKGGFQGSAHNQGTIVSKGHAYAGGTLSGNWGLPQAEKGALINELGSEIVVTPDGHWQILNGGDPTFTNLPKGAIIFNHKQTESLLKKGYVNGSHGKMVGGAFATGTVDDEDLDGNAYAVGTAKWNGQLSGMSHAGNGTGSFGAANRARTHSTNNSSNNRSRSGNHHSGSNHNGSNNSSSNKKAKDNLQTLDAIEIRLNRIDALIARLDTNAAKTYDTFANRNTALKDDLATVNKEIQAINSSLKSSDKTRNYLLKAADAAKEAGLKSGDEGYSSKSEGASGKALSQDWINKIKNFVDSGRYFTVTDVRNEGLWKKIQAYQTWYEKYVKLQQKVQEQTNKLSQLTIQQLTLIQTKWETSLNNIAADITKWQNTIDLANEKGYDAAEKYYNAEILLNKNRTKKLEAEAKELENKLKEAVKTGRIKEGSEEWYKWHIQIKNVKNEIIATNKEIQSLLNSIRQIRWDTFDRGQDELADMIDEAEFLGGLINEIDLFDKDTGFVTDKGKAAFGLEAQKYDLYIKQAQKYGEAVKELNAEIAKDPNNKTLIDQRNTWLKAQREAIENAHAEKEAIADLVEKGIKKQIEAMEELIDKYEKALDAEKDQQKYADNVAEKQKKINSLQKQLRSMEGDDSEEGATRRQKLRDELKEAQKDLKEAQEDQRISDIKDALSDMQERYEKFLNTKLEDIDALLQEVVSGVNQSGADICSTIQDVAHSVNYTISSNLQATYTAVQNLGANVASIANQIGALVSGTSDTTGTMTNTSATTVRNAPTPVVPTKVTMPTEPKKTTGSTGTSKAKNGIVKENGKTYYYKNGKKQTGWQTINGKKYYFSTKDSNMLTGVQKIGNKYYLLDKSTGVLKDKYSGLYKQNSGTYYFKNGDMQTGWQSMNAGKRYFSTKNGKMLTGVQTIGKDNYYFNEDGVLQVGKFNVGDYTYETDKDGKIKKKTRRTGGVTSIKGNTILSTMSYIEGKGTGGITGFASGTKKVPKDDIYRVDEMGKEAFINKQGKIYTRLEKGTTVLPHDAAVNLLKGMSNPAEFIASHMDMRPNKNITTTNNNTGNTVNNITFNLPNVSDYKEFMREAQRDPNFTKYIQEISIGKLNGNNSLRGNAIQFR